MKWVPIIAVITIFLYVTLVRAKAADPGKLVDLLKDGAMFIDVRTPGEFAESAVPGAVNYPLNNLETEIKASHVDKDQCMLLFCKSGGRSMMGVRKLKALGYTNVINVGSFGNALQTAEMMQSETSPEHSGK